MVEPKACPFCGGKVNLLNQPRGREFKVFYMLCSICGTEGPKWPTAEAAEAHWKERVP